jgi:hypothetical protein
MPAASTGFSRGGHLFEGMELPSRSDPTWLRIIARSEPPAPDPTWLTEKESALFTGRDMGDIARAHLPTRRERDARNRVTVFYDADVLRQVFRPRDARLKLALLECSVWQLKREFVNTGDPELMKWIGECITLRSRPAPR